MEKNYQDEFEKKIKLTEAKQADLDQRMAAFKEAHDDHFFYLIKRAMARNIDLKGTAADKYNRDLNKFLLSLGLKDIIDNEDIIEQQFAINAYREYRLFGHEQRSIKRELLEHKIETARKTIASLYEAMETQRKMLNIDGLDLSDRLVRNEYRHLKMNVDNFITETQAAIDKMEAMIRLDELRLANLQQAQLN